MYIFINGKGNVFHVLIKNSSITKYGGDEVQIHAFLNSALMEVSGKLHAPVALSSGKEAPVHIG
jgi:hypothetical protein